MKKYVLKIVSIILGFLVLMYLFSLVFNSYLYEQFGINKELAVISALRVFFPAAILLIYIIFHSIYHRKIYVNNKKRNHNFKEPRILKQMILVPICVLLGILINVSNTSDVVVSSFSVFLDILKGIDIKYIYFLFVFLLFSILLPRKLSRNTNLPMLDVIVYTSVSLIVPFFLIGLFFSGVYAFLSMSGFGFTGIEASSDYIYFSFVTQTTLGYGEMLPNHYVSKYVVVAQSIIGIFYMGVAVSVTLGAVLENGSSRRELD